MPKVSRAADRAWRGQMGGEIVGEFVHMRSDSMSHAPRSTRHWLGSFCLVLSMCLTSACSLWSGGTLLYNQQDSQVGLQPDPTISRGSSDGESAACADDDGGDSVLSVRCPMVSGWSGTLVGILEQPRPVPVFTDTELNPYRRADRTSLSAGGPHTRVFSLTQVADEIQ